MEKVDFYGWKDCVRLANDAVELVVTTQVGPRVVHLARRGCHNLLGLDESLLGKVGPANKWVNYGGHRLWHGPELKHRTYEPDNEPVEVSAAADGGILFTAPTERNTAIQKQMQISIAAGSAPVVRVDHHLTNRSDDDVSLAVWALTVVAPGGRVILPHEPYAAHGAGDNYLPARPLVLWPYTNMGDSRWTWGERYIQLTPDAASTEPQKLGAFVSEGWGAYAAGNGDLLLVLIPPPAGGPDDYIDFGSNFETFTKGDFQELETLGPLVSLVPGATATHRETWYIGHGDPLPEDDALLHGRLEGIRAAAAKVLAGASFL